MTEINIDPLRLREIFSGKAMMRDARVGDRVVSRANMCDYDGSTFDKGESGTIIKTTSSTIHVQDPRGHVHKRYRYFFDRVKEELTRLESEKFYGTFQHYKGGYYDVVSLIDFMDNDTLCVLYKSHETGRSYVRTLWNFHMPIKGTLRRFTKVVPGE